MARQDKDNGEKRMQAEDVDVDGVDERMAEAIYARILKSLYNRLSY